LTGLVLTTFVALATGALAPAPERVKYVTTKGDVTFDHRAHTGRREACKTCHVAGPIRKVELDKKSAHALCLGCHLTKRVGPKGCTECHDDA
jgi:hypothetical protein